MEKDLSMELCPRMMIVSQEEAAQNRGLEMLTGWHF